MTTCPAAAVGAGEGAAGDDPADGVALAGCALPPAQELVDGQDAHVPEVPVQ